uniref:BRICHOS domain containing 5 n=1 Tax=Anas platyrhynchos TaxID=8839 RepID=A0A8B9R5K9_ANAPL
MSCPPPGSAGSGWGHGGGCGWLLAGAALAVCPGRLAGGAGDAAGGAGPAEEPDRPWWTASRSTVTYYITSRSNRSAVVLYDSQNGYVCYRPAEQHACYLRRMEPGDRESTRGTLSTAELRVSDGHGRGVPGGKGGAALSALCRGWTPEGLGEAVQALCEQTPIFWVRRQRLIYLCIDICFPSNICVSICFYYLPE